MLYIGMRLYIGMFQNLRRSKIVGPTVDQTQSSNTHIYAYITAAQVKHNGDRSPEVPRDADPVVYTLRCISKSSLDGGGDSFLYRLFLDSFLVMPVFAIGHGCSTTNSRNTQ